MIKNFLSKIYILSFMVLTLFFMFITWKVTFGHIVEEYHDRKIAVDIAAMKDAKKQGMEESDFKKTILNGEETVKRYLGYRILEDKRIEGHFHHIDFEVGPDNRSYCVQCHGDMPHDKVKELRAFGNMHASFISCQTCHVKLVNSEKTGVFKWYDRETGDIVPSPVKEGVNPGSYKSKIIPFERVNGQFQRIDNQKRMNFAREFKETEDTLTELQKTKAKKIIHKVVSKQPYICENCHNKDTPLLPFEDLGYSKTRIDAFISTEVVGMINNYTKFYMPRILHPGAIENRE